MFRRPPVHLLHIFEAAARHSSFKKAGEELNITASAVSHQIKSLEEVLSVKLFTRVTRGVVLTDTGREYAYAIGRAFNIIDEGTQNLTQQRDIKHIKISMMPSLANNVVYPHIESFEKMFPNLDIQIESSEENVDLNKERFDCAIRLGEGHWPEYQTRLLSQAHAVLLCSPAFYKQHQINSPQQLSSLPLVSLSHMEELWFLWAKAFKLSQFNIKKAVKYNSYNHTIQAALQDLGIATGVYELEKRLIEQGKLIPLFDCLAPIDRSLYLVYRKGQTLAEPVEQFIGWLVSLLKRE